MAAHADRDAPSRIIVAAARADGLKSPADILRSAGFEVTEATAGTHVVELLRPRPDLIVVDVDLPDIDGSLLCRRLAGNPRTAAVAMVQVSARFREPSDRTRALDAGADACLTLPVQRDELVATVRAVLRGRRLERERAALQAVTELAYAAAHEINNPLAVITAQLHFLANDPAVPAARVAAVVEAAGRIRTIVAGMMRITHLETAEPRPLLPAMLDLARSSDDPPRS